MAKPRSMKMRTFLTLHALFKYSDKDHRMNSRKLNEYLRPYNLDCDQKVLSHTAQMMKEFGFDIRSKGEWEHQGIWIENRPLPDHELSRLIFAVTTNPHLSREQATDILQSLKPFVTVYQEHLLQGLVEAPEGADAPKVDDSLYWTYLVVQEAISAGRRVRYSVDYLKYDKESQTVSKQSQWPTLFTPKCIYQSQGKLYMVGWNNTDQRADAVNLKNITSIKLAYKHHDSKADMVSQWIAGIDPQACVPGEAKEVIYEGPVTFRCRGQFIGDIYNRFGSPDAGIDKDNRGRTTYSIQNAVITSEDLFWLSQIPEHGIRIAAPETLRDSVKAYYERASSALLNSFIPANKPK